MEATSKRPTDIFCVLHCLVDTCVQPIIIFSFRFLTCLSSTHVCECVFPDVHLFSM